MIFRQIYWLGDLNYRINSLNTQQVKNLVARNEIVTLLKSDQLNQEKDRGNVLLVSTHIVYKCGDTFTKKIA